MDFSPSIERVIEAFAKLPGIGKKTAERLAFHIIQENNSQVQEFLNAIVNAKRNLKVCKKCFNISDTEICPICQDERRDKEKICVVEDVKNIIALEKTNRYNGLYHVLGGAISPLNGVRPEDLNLKELIVRVTEDEIKEVILATSLKVDGETTASYISNILKNTDVKVTKLANGIPMGGDLEYIDENTLGKAFEGRTEM